MLSKLFAGFGWTSDDLKWNIAIAAAVIVGLSTAFTSPEVAAYYGLPPAWLPKLRGLALIIGIVSGVMRTSGLPNKIGAWFLAVAVGLGALSTAACGQTATAIKAGSVVTLEAAETALEAAHDLERSTCNALADQTQPITTCTPDAAALGLTTAKHQAIAKAFAKAFTVNEQAAAALKLWKPGDPAPASFVAYVAAANDIATAAATLAPSLPFVSKLTNALGQIQTINTTVGGTK